MKKHIFPPTDRFSAYLLGFYAADGSYGSSSIFYIHQKDRTPLDRMADILNNKYNVPAKVIKRNSLEEMHFLHVRSKKDCIFLKKIGLSRRKTYFAKSIPIERDLLGYFIVGFIDGDGCVATQEGIDSIGSISISCMSVAPSFIKWLVRASNDLGIGFKLSENFRGVDYYPQFTLSTRTVGDSIRLYCLAKQCGFIMERKWTKLRAYLLRYLQHKKETLKHTVKNRAVPTVICSICSKEYKLRKNYSNTTMCSACKEIITIKHTHKKRRDLLKNTRSIIRLSKQKEREKNWSKTCHHCGKDIVRKKINKTGNYFCDDCFQYTHLYR